MLILKNLSWQLIFIYSKHHKTMLNLVQRLLKNTQLQMHMKSFFIVPFVSGKCAAQMPLYSENRKKKQIRRSPILVLETELKCFSGC